MGCLGVLVLLAVLAALGGSWVLAGHLLTPVRRLPQHLDPLQDYRCEDITLHTSDGLAIAAWAALPDRAPRAAAILLHAKDGCRSAYRTAFALRAGLAVLAPDLRAHGKSEGEFTGLGWNERAEVAAAVAEAHRRWPGLPLVGWGVSMGAAALVYALDPELPDALPAGDFSALVLESLYADIDSAFENRVRLKLGEWALPLASLPRAMAAWRGGLPTARMRPLESLSRIHREAGDGLALLLASGALDHRTPPSDLYRLAEACDGRAVLVEGAAHEDLLVTATSDEWETTLRAFLADRTRGR